MGIAGLVNDVEKPGTYGQKARQKGALATHADMCRPRSGKSEIRTRRAPPPLQTADVRLAARCYGAVISATVVSSIRLENPHSLSYQLPTLTSLPETLVSDSSKVLDAGL